MPDLKQEGTEVAPVTQNVEAQAAVPEKVRLRHPHTGDTVDVNAVPEAMIPILGRGYQQVKE
jgi:hypothetical protein